MARSMSLSGMLTRCRLGRFPLCQGENLRSNMAKEVEYTFVFLFRCVVVVVVVVERAV